jgi:hypothetical protein
MLVLAHQTRVAVLIRFWKRSLPLSPLEPLSPSQMEIVFLGYHWLFNLAFYRDHKNCSVGTPISMLKGNTAPLLPIPSW